MPAITQEQDVQLRRWFRSRSHEHREQEQEKGERGFHGECPRQSKEVGWDSI